MTTLFGMVEYNANMQKDLNAETESIKIPLANAEEQIAQLKADNLILMDVLATMYEDMLAKGTV